MREGGGGGGKFTAMDDRTNIEEEGSSQDGLQLILESMF
jgi:hypothetical protein